MGFETINALGHPAMFESFVKLCRRLLQLHPCLQAVRRLGAPPDKAVNLFLDVDERLFHDAASISCDLGQSKRPAAGAGLMNQVRGGEVLQSTSTFSSLVYHFEFYLPTIGNISNLSRQISVKENDLSGCYGRER